MLTQFSRSKAFDSSVEWHRRQLRTFSSKVSPLFSDETCLCCIRRRPQHRFICGHLVCQTCIKVFYAADPNDRWLLRVHSCLLCGAGASDVAIRTIPDTARARVLSIDGGGVRGCAPIKMLHAIQEVVGIPGLDVQRNFDVAVGTSSGLVNPCNPKPNHYLSHLPHASLRKLDPLIFL